MNIQPRVYFYRDGRELTNHPLNGKMHVGFGVFAGVIRKLPCFTSVIVRGTRDEELTEADFDGRPVMVKVWQPGRRVTWFAVASPETVARRSSKAEATAA